MIISRLKRALRLIFDVNNLALYVFTALALSLVFSTAKTIEKNKSLEADIDRLAQELAVVELQGEKLRLENEYYKTDSFLELEARRRLNKAAPGEQVLILPSSTIQNAKPIALDQAEQETIVSSFSATANLKQWLTYLLGL